MFVYTLHCNTYCPYVEGSNSGKCVSSVQLLALNKKQCIYSSKNLFYKMRTSKTSWRQRELKLCNSIFEICTTMPLRFMINFHNLEQCLTHIIFVHSRLILRLKHIYYLCGSLIIKIFFLNNLLLLYLKPFSDIDLIMKVCLCLFHLNSLVST